MKTGFDVVSSPSHYTKGRTVSPVHAFIDWGLTACLFSAAKYLVRAGYKKSCGATTIDDAVLDLRKAIQYITFEIERLQGMTEEQHKLELAVRSRDVDQGCEVGHE